MWDIQTQHTIHQPYPASISCSSISCIHIQQADSHAGLLLNMCMFRFITVNDASRRRLFYTLVQSRHDPLRDPLILWLQG